MSDVKQPCGCHEQSLLDSGELDMGEGLIPSLADFEQQLQQIAAVGPGEAAISELELAGLEASLSSLDALTLDADSDVPSLSDLLRLLERFPGLKLSLSY